jgi:hypothetical protein
MPDAVHGERHACRPKSGILSGRSSAADLRATMRDRLNVSHCLPDAHQDAMLIGRVFVAALEGPVLVRVQADGIHDLSAIAATSSQLLALDHPADTIRSAGPLPRLASTADVLANSAHDARDPSLPWFLAPCDLQALKASGVTFVASTLERVIEEQARGDAAKAESVRREIVAVIGDNLSRIRPGSACTPLAGAAPASLMRIFSGRTAKCRPSRSITFETPTKPATNALPGRS